MRKKPNKVILFERLDLRKIKASMPERDWRRPEEICVTYNMDVNKLVA